MPARPARARPDKPPAMPTVLSGPSQLLTLAGADLGATAWRTLPFEQIVAFAEATGDRQWIHVDRERAERESPFGAPIAHGYLTLSLVAGCFFQLVEVEGFKMVINYGCNKVRFPTPMKAGSSYRVAMKVGEVTDIGKGWTEVQFLATVEIEGSAKPACAAEVIYRFLA